VTRPAIVVTSVNPPGEAMSALAQGAGANDIQLIVVGDSKSPSTYALANCRFLSLDEQL
jgi:ABC-type Zn2+ transport system substrate-binding protein/surface adhesin